MDQSKIYVGNLSYDTTNEDLNELFGQYGPIAEVKLITDRETGRSKGFAFITFEEQQSAAESLAQNGEEFQNRRLKVSIAKEREAGGGGGRRGGGGNGGGGRGRGQGQGQRW